MAPAKRISSPAFQFYPEAWSSSSKVKRMSHTERGIYIDLLAQCWMDNGLPTDIEQIGAIVGIRKQRFARVWAGPLHECFFERNGKLFNARQERERKKQAEFRKSKQDAAHMRWTRPAFTPTDPPASPLQCLVVSDRISDRISDRDLKKKEGGEQLDVAFRTFQEAYPPSRRKGGRLVEEAFLFAAHSAGGPSALMAALENHKASEQWRNPSLIPGMDTWFSEERWRQTLPAAGSLTAAAASNQPAWLQRVNARKATQS